MNEKSGAKIYNLPSGSLIKPTETWSGYLSPLNIRNGDVVVVPPPRHASLIIDVGEITVGSGWEGRYSVRWSLYNGNPRWEYNQEQIDPDEDWVADGLVTHPFDTPTEIAVSGWGPPFCGEWGDERPCVAWAQAVYVLGVKFGRLEEPEDNLRDLDHRFNALDPEYEVDPEPNRRLRWRFIHRIIGTCELFVAPNATRPPTE